MKNNVEKLKDILTMLDKRTVSPADLQKVVSRIIETVNGAHDRVLKSIDRKSNAAFLEMLRKSSADMKRFIMENDRQSAEAFRIELSKIQSALKDFDSKIAEELDTQLENIRPSTPQEIREALMALRGADRIDVSAIEGLEGILEDIRIIKKDGTKKTSLIGWGRPGVDISVNGVEYGAIQYVSLIAGAGVTLAHSISGGKHVITISSTASSAFLTTSSTIDDSNKNFTFSTLPSVLIINGLYYTQTGGSITWTWDGTSVVTLSAPVGLGGSIFGLV